jgi:hypothetical protein
VLVNTYGNEPDIKREQAQATPNLTDDTPQHRQEEARYGMSVPLMIAIVGGIFLLVIIGAIIATR